jgi:hypothetical protein
MKRTKQAKDLERQASLIRQRHAKENRLGMILDLQTPH